MKTKQRFLSLLLCGVMLFSLCPASVFAEEVYNHNIAEKSIIIDDTCGANCSHIITGTSTQNTIKITGGTHNITLDGVEIAISDQNICAFAIEGSAKVNLTLINKNVLKGGKGGTGREGLSLGYNAAELTITADSTGSLEAIGGETGMEGGAGIGCFAGSKITINGGKIIAKGGGDAAGIGSRYFSDAGEIVITGGTVIAKGGSYAAGIGGGMPFEGDGGGGGIVTITGGTVVAMGGSNAAGIGNGMGSSGGTFAADGSAIIFASSISDQSNKNDWRGVIFEGVTYDEATAGSFEITPPNVIIKENVEIPANAHLTIGAGSALTVNQDVTLTNRGEIINNGTIDNEGEITNGGIFTNKGALTGSGILPNGVYSVKVTAEPFNGTAAASTEWAQEGNTVKLTAAPNSDGHFKKWQVISGGAVLDDASSATTSFSMPADETTIEAIFEAHSGGSATCVEQAVCDICQEKYGALSQHTLTKHEAVAATCEKAGSIQYWECAVCGKNFSDEQGTTAVDGIVVSPLGHTGGTATCSARAVCTRCQMEYGATDNSNHVHKEVRNRLEATADKDGYTGDIWCTDCNTQLETGSIIPATGGTTPPTHNHHWNTAEWTRTDTHHWHECIAAGCNLTDNSRKNGYGAHVYDSAADEYCNTCNYKRTVTPPAEKAYTVTIKGSYAADSGSGRYDEGETVAVNAGSRGDYRFNGWTTTSSAVTFANAANPSTAFTMPAQDVLVTANWLYNGGTSSGGSWDFTPADITYTITAKAGVGGSISPSGAVSALEGRDKTFTIVPQKGYVIADVLIDGRSIGAVESYTFKDVQTRHTIEAVFRTESTELKPSTEDNSSSAAKDFAFTDVAKTDWFYQDVRFVWEKDLMTGTSETTFAPNASATRAQLAAIFYRMEGSPKTEGRNSFIDLAHGADTAWYYDAVTWAEQNGIMSGYDNGAFAPDDPVTREQLAAIFYRYARYKGYDTAAAGNLDRFIDGAEISPWARENLSWAVGVGLMNGTAENQLSPQGTAARAQIAAMLQRFAEQFA